MKTGSQQRVAASWPQVRGACGSPPGGGSSEPAWFAKEGKPSWQMGAQDTPGSALPMQSPAPALGSSHTC